MGQQDILTILERAKKPMSALEIANAIKLKTRTDKAVCDIITVVFHGINKMIKYDEVKCIEIDRQQAMKLYRCKRRMKLYYV